MAKSIPIETGRAEDFGQLKFFIFNAPSFFLKLRTFNCTLPISPLLIYHNLLYIELPTFMPVSDLMVWKSLHCNRAQDRRDP